MALLAGLHVAMTTNASSLTVFLNWFSVFQMNVLLLALPIRQQFVIQ